MSGVPPAQFLVGQRVRIRPEARGEHWPDVGHWVVEVCYNVPDKQILYGVSEVWPPNKREDIQEGLYASDLFLWAD